MPTTAQRYDGAVAEFEKYLRVRDIHGPEELLDHGFRDLDASSTIFADDITKRTVTKTPQEVITKVVKASKQLTNIAADIGIVMNQSKEEHQVGFVGPGSVKSMRTLYKGNEWPEGMGKLCPTQRVLGTLAHIQL